MTPIGSATIGTAWFLNGLADLQKQQAQTERELSSGYRINDASDSPSQTPELIQLSSTLAAVQTYQENLGSIQTEATAADQAIGSSITLLQNAETLAAQGANSSSTAATNQILATQVQSIQQQVVAIANTTVAGRAIFGGSQDQSPPYQYDAASASGADALTVPGAGRVIVNTQGQPVYQALTAQQIFDPVDAAGAPTANNTFAALQNLETALQTPNDQAGIASALASLETASTYLNQQQAYYGAAEQRITNEQNTASNQVTSLQTQIGNIRDTDFAQAATDLTQEQTDQSAALGAEAEISPKSLFDYLG